MNRKQGFILGLIISLLPITGMAQRHQQTTEASSQEAKILTVKRGQTITSDELSAIADVSSARDQKGNAVVPNEKNYEVGSFTRATISVVPVGGKNADVITLDLLKPSN